MSRKTNGFTLVELIVVIVLLGILAATALPKFIDLTGEARKAAAQDISGSLGAGVSLAHGLWLAKGSTGTTTVLSDGTTVYMSAAGWPTDTSSTSGGAPGGTSTSTTMSKNACQDIWAGLMQNAPPINPAKGTPLFSTDFATTVCTFSDSATPTPNKITYDASTGVIDFIPGS